jgi:hypothetical protein
MAKISGARLRRGVVSANESAHEKDLTSVKKQDRRDTVSGLTRITCVSRSLIMSIFARFFLEHPVTEASFTAAAQARAAFQTPLCRQP